MGSNATECVWAIVPVKPMQIKGSRLAHVLSPAERGELMQQLLTHVVAQLQQTAIVNTLVVSADPAIGRLAQAAGATVYDAIDTVQFNAAVQGAVEHAWSAGAGTVAVFPGDLGFLTAADVTQLLATPGVAAIVPDRRLNGTNALLLRRFPTFRFSFGDESFMSHLQEAARHDVVAQVVYADSLEFNVETPADLQIYRRRLEQEDQQQ